MASEYVKLHGASLAQPVEYALAELGRTLRRAHGHVGQRIFAAIRTQVLSMTPAAATAFLDEPAQVELQARIFDPPIYEDHTAHWTREKLVRVTLTERARRVAALAGTRAEVELRAGLTVVDADGRRLFQTAAAWRAAAPHVRAAVLMAQLELEEARRRLYPLDDVLPG